MLDETGKPMRLAWAYTRPELIADAVIHIIGGAFALGALAVLVVLGVLWASAPQMAGVLAYGLCLLASLGVSAAYNMWPVSRTKWLLRRADHAMIFMLIAGTYTPFLVLLPDGVVAAALLAGIWTIALAGVATKLLWPGRFDRAMIVGYLALGWSGVVAANAIYEAVPGAALVLIGVGGVIYSLGVVFHVWRSFRFQNAIWHGFVLVAASCHFAAVVVTLV